MRSAPHLSGPELMKIMLCGTAHLLIAATCLAQTAKPAATPSSLDDIAAITAHANEGNTEAEVKLGDAYMRGRGVPQDGAKALRWFRAAAEKGNADAQYELGNLYGAGIAVKQDD